MGADRMMPHVLHGTFSLEFDVAADPVRVFAAYADPAVRRMWFRMPAEPGTGHYELDFRVGGGEIARGAISPAGGPLERMEYRSWFLDIADGQRIVLGYEFTLDDVRRWVSQVTIEFGPRPDSGTRITHTEQYALLAYPGDGKQDADHLRGGTRLQFNALAAALAGLSAAPSVKPGGRGSRRWRLAPTSAG
jgi:uncharacterized protein YndB with AHSA1/START domain